MRRQVINTVLILAGIFYICTFLSKNDKGAANPYNSNDHNLKVSINSSKESISMVSSARMNMFYSFQEAKTEKISEKAHKEMAKISPNLKNINVKNQNEVLSQKTEKPSSSSNTTIKSRKKKVV